MSPFWLQQTVPLLMPLVKRHAPTAQRPDAHRVTRGGTRQAVRLPGARDGVDPASILYTVSVEHPTLSAMAFLGEVQLMAALLEPLPKRGCGLHTHISPKGTLIFEASTNCQGNCQGNCQT